MLKSRQNRRGLRAVAMLRSVVVRGLALSLVVFMSSGGDAFAFIAVRVTIASTHRAPVHGAGLRMYLAYSVGLRVVAVPSR